MRLTLLSFLLALLPLAASAEVVEIDGIYYNLVPKAKLAEVTKNPSHYTGEVVIPESVNYNGETYDVTSIEGSAFAYCYNLTSVIIGNRITTIGDGTFNECNNLKSITIPGSVNSIATNAFRHCI